MTRTRIVLVVVLLALAGLAFWLVLGRGGGADEASADIAPTATVTVAPVRSETLKDVAKVYGVVQADQAGSSTVAAPRAVAVTRLFVRLGEAVAAGQPLVEVAS
ncbi:MAG: hypothetical protein ACREEW_00985, partial [Caulobacteraceae bacterium]